MAHLYYDDNIITSETSAPGSADSFAGPGEHDSGVPDTSRFAVLSGRVWQLMQRERALLLRSSPSPPPPPTPLPLPPSLLLPPLHRAPSPPLTARLLSVGFAL